MCSNGFRAGMEKLLHKAERDSGRTAKVQFGASANLKKSIESGEPFDLAILTPQVIDALIKEGKIAAGTKVDLASSGVGLAVRAGASKPDIATAPGNEANPSGGEIYRLRCEWAPGRRPSWTCWIILAFATPFKARPSCSKARSNP